MKINKKIFSIHSFLGLISGIFILIFSLTGAVVVFFDELNEVIYSDLLTTKAEQPNRLSFHQAYTLACAKYPGYIPYRINHGINHKEETIEVGFQKNNFKERFSVYIDPYSGKILGKLENPFTLVLLKFHYTFYLGKIGELLAAIFAISFIGSIITGTIVYRKYFWKALLFKVPLKFKNWRTASSELHRVLGVWALVFNFILAFSGFWLMKYTFDFKSHFSESKIHAAPDPVRFPIDKLFLAAKQQVPDLTINYISLPRRKGDPLKFLGDIPGNILYGEYNNSVEYDPLNGKLLRVTKETDMSGEEKFEQILYSLHFGGYGGIIIKIIYSFMGLVTSVISITGFVLWWRRNKKSIYKKRD